MLSVGLPMGSDTHKQHGQGGGNMGHFRMRIEPLNVALQAMCGMVTTRPTLAALPVYPRFSHTGCLLLIRSSAMVLYVLRGLVRGAPHALAAWPLLTFSLSSYSLPQRCLP